MNRRGLRALAAGGIFLAAAPAPALAQSSPAGGPPITVPADALVPTGWRLEYEARGHLDSDDREDLVLVLHENDPKNFDPGYAWGGYGVDTNPRRLVIALGDVGGYRVIASNDTLIPRRDSPVLDEPITEAPTIRGGLLTVGLGYMVSAGGGAIGSYDYRFYVRNDEVYLASLETGMTANRIDRIYRKVWMDFVDGYGLEVVSDFEEISPRSRLIRMEPRAISLAEVGNGFDFAFGPWLPPA
jgi:hypothetical protein